MRAYLDILNNVLHYGQKKYPVRKQPNGEFIEVDNGNPTIGLPNVVFSHNMQDGFPLLTTKRVAYKTMARELEGFIKGITSKNWYKSHDCNIWNEWCNPTKASSKDQQLEEDDLGPIYGYQWRRFGEVYDENDGGPLTGFDQLKNIVQTLRTNYNDRRMVCSAWNPNQINLMALPPCHILWDVTVYGKCLNLAWVQRSCDLLLGIPFNIASYALLLTLLAKDAGLQVGNLTGLLVDCHLYNNQLEVARLQLEREPLPLPQVSINNNSTRGFDIFEWTADNLEFIGYNPHKKLPKVDVVV